MDLWFCTFYVVYATLCVYIIPISLTMSIYFKVVRCVKQIRKYITPVNTLLHAQRELQTVRCIVILIGGVATIGFPYEMFVHISFFTSPPKYHFRIAFLFVDASMVYVTIALFVFTQPLQRSIMKRFIVKRTPLIQEIK